MLKALFNGCLFGVFSESQLASGIEINLARRWFLRLKLSHPVFDFLALSQNRRRFCRDSRVAQDIFDHVVEQAIGQELRLS